MDAKKFCYIICCDDDDYYRECAFYISHLRMPVGFTAEILPMKDAKSMASAYNRAMDASDAKYKIYLHQDVFILNPNFLNDILTVFAMDETIGMVGMLGTEHLSPDGVEWNSPYVGGIYEESQGKPEFGNYMFLAEDGVTDCEALDGMLLVTNRDLRWREDLFEGWNFWDVAQSFEFRKAGFRVVVPTQQKPWCAHEEGILNLWTYDKDRRIFLKEYMP